MYSVFKRIFDIVFAIILLIFIFPVFIIVAVAIKIEDPEGPIFFIQDRGGRNNSLIRVIKFRTMIAKRQHMGRGLTDVERMLKLGKIIRKLSLDELPQIINILKGELSFIGPRPLSYKFIPYYTEEELHRHDVMPGISGWAQVNGRNNLSWEEKFALDLYYVRNINFMLDLKIFFMTIKKVLIKPEVGVLGEDIHFKPIHLVRQMREIERKQVK